MNHIAIAIHGGAGSASDKAKYESSLMHILGAGHQKLLQGASALDVVEHCVSLLENDPLFNAGRGSVLNEDGKVEMDASIMNGQTLAAGAVAGIRTIKNPVQLARLVMEKSEHVFLIGAGAEAFGRSLSVTEAPPEYFITKARVEQLSKAESTNKIVLDHGDTLIENKVGTVGCVAKDIAGNLAAATSTGGIVNKRFGRVGDTPVIGAGTYADNETCAVSGTGFGEQFIRTALAKTVSDLVLYKGFAAQDAAREGIRILLKKVRGLGGVIVVDKNGAVGIAHSTPGIACGYSKQDGLLMVAFEAERVL